MREQEEISQKLESVGDDMEEMQVCGTVLAGPPLALSVARRTQQQLGLEKLGSRKAAVKLSAQCSLTPHNTHHTTHGAHRRSSTASRS